MASRQISIFDLIENSSDEKAVATVKYSTTGQPAREALEVIQNNARPARALNTGVSPALKNVFQTLSERRLRAELELVYREHEGIRRDLERKFLVKGKEVVRYDASEESEDEGEDQKSRSSRPRQPNTMAVAVSEDEWTPRYATCENCNNEFDITLNFERHCRWHSGPKLVNDGSDFWDEHDEGCHGRCEDFKDDPDYAEGFSWYCCETPGDNEGCKTTKHKANVNVPTGPLSKHATQAEVKYEDTDSPNKTKDHLCSSATSNIALSSMSTRINAMQCRRCLEEYDPNDNERIKCIYHPGVKRINKDSGKWSGHNDSRSSFEMFLDNYDYADGFTWTCCEGAGGDHGCQEGNHILEDAPEAPTLPMSKKRKAEEEMVRPATYVKIF